MPGRSWQRSEQPVAKRPPLGPRPEETVAINQSPSGRDSIDDAAGSREVGHHHRRDRDGASREQDVVASSIVTISGCLEQNDERFRLKDTAGEDAPKGRSWRSGFLRRSASTIDVIDHADRHHLPTYVGQRVSVTGTLVDREMQVRSVAIVAESCQEKSA